jgi:hypothetical protein
MAVSMYPISVPVFIKHLNGLAGCLKKAQAYYAGKKFDEASLMSQRFFPDMFTFAKQVQVMTDHAKSCTANLAGMEAPKYEDNEKSLADLVARIEKTVEFLKSVKPAQIDGTEDKAINIKLRDRELNMKGLEFLLNRSLPNFYFHATTAYDILRNNGVEIGKRDFMGAA